MHSRENSFEEGEDDVILRRFEYKPQNIGHASHGNLYGIGIWTKIQKKMQPSKQARIREVKSSPSSCDDLVRKSLNLVDGSSKASS